MDILDDMGVSKLSANVFSKVNYSFNLNGSSREVNKTTRALFKLKVGHVAEQVPKRVQGERSR